MIEADGYASESDASAYSETTYGYDADDTCDNATADEGNDLTVNATASRQRQPPSGCYVSQTKGETNPNNLVISVLDIGKGCYSLP
jgi:hypothetical protein